MNEVVYTATFQTETLKRKSARVYAAAWRVAFVRTGSYQPGTTGVESGFSRTQELAQKAADAFVASITTNFTNPKARRGYRPKPQAAYQILSAEVVLTEVAHQITSKPRRTFQATFADGQTISRNAGVEYRFAARVTLLGTPTSDRRDTWTDWFFTAQAAQATTAARIASHQDFYRNLKNRWGVPDWDCQATVEIVPTRELKPLTADEADGGARFEAVQNAGIDY